MHDACTKYHLSLKHFSKSITEHSVPKMEWQKRFWANALQCEEFLRMLKSCYATICQSLIVCRGFSFCTHFINDSNFRLLAPHSLLWLPSPCFWLVGWILHNYPEIITLHDYPEIIRWHWSSFWQISSSSLSSCGTKNYAARWIFLIPTKVDLKWYCHFFRGTTSS